MIKESIVPHQGGLLIKSGGRSSDRVGAGFILALALWEECGSLLNYRREPEGVKLQWPAAPPNTELDMRAPMDPEGRTFQTDDLIGPPAKNDADDQTPTVARVARGRTVEVPTGEKVFRCFDQAGKAIYRAAVRRYSDGDEVTLPRGEARRLMQLGFLVDENRVIKSEAEATRLLGAPVVDLDTGKKATTAGRKATA